MTPISDSVSPLSLGRPTLRLAEPDAVADGLLRHATTTQGTDVNALRVGIDTLARANPALANAASSAVTAQLSPVEAGTFAGSAIGFGGNFWDSILDFVDKVIADSARAEGASFQSDVTGAASPSDAPRSVQFSSGVQQTFQEQWINSLPGGNALEQGGTLTFNRETGTIGVTNLGGHGSTAGTFSPDYSLSDRQNLAGVFHTHPYSEAEGGFRDVSFSGGDIGIMLQEGHQMAVVQSGDTQFMILRTDATPAGLDGRAVAAEVDARFEELLGNGVDFAEASRTAAQEAADKYGLAYYQGSNGSLTRIN